MAAIPPSTPPHSTPAIPRRVPHIADHRLHRGRGTMTGSLTDPEGASWPAVCGRDPGGRRHGAMGTRHRRDPLSGHRRGAAQAGYAGVIGREGWVRTELAAASDAFVTAFA